MKRPILSSQLLLQIFIAVVLQSFVIEKVIATDSGQMELNDNATMTPVTKKAAQITRRTSSSNIKAPRSKKVDSSQLNKESSDQTARTDQRTTTSKMASNQDPSELAQEQVRLMFGYNNTPPLFITSTRDLFVDVSRFPLGTKVTTINAHDEEGDQIRFSLEPANTHDASPYFSIDPVTGELRLANKEFLFITAPSQRQQPVETDDGNDEDNAEEVRGDGLEPAVDVRQNDDDKSAVEQELLSRNLYFLNVVAFDGTYQSVLELKIHVVNSSLQQAAIKSTSKGGVHVQLRPESAGDQLKSIMRNKTIEFYDHLYRGILPVESPAIRSNKSVVVYPNFVNPGLTKPTVGSSSQVQANTQPDVARQILQAPDIAVPQILMPTTPASVPGQITSDKGQFEAIQAQPMVVSLVVACSLMMIAMVLLMFIVPISVKKLRRRLKHVERRHEQLSHQNSHGSTTIGSSGSESNMTDHKHHGCSSLSQFTMTSDRSCTMRGSIACRQSSLDSSSMATVRSQPHTAFGGFNQRQPPLNRVNNGSIVNPMYLHQDHPQLHRQLAQPVNILPQQAQPYFVRDQPTLEMPQTQSSNALYYPIDDDEFYSTINTESTILEPEIPSAHMMGLPAPQSDTTNNHDIRQSDFNARLVESPTSIVSGSSTRSLARFLSLPARHSSHQNPDQSDDSIDADRKIDGLGLDFSAKPRAPFQTIARTVQVDRERLHQKQFAWELDRYRLKFLNLLDEGQFGQVWRCKMSSANQIEKVDVAVKTLKKEASRDERGREELLAEIEIMKLVCDHPNVVKILGCCTRDVEPLKADLAGRPILLVMEYVELGKLQSFLKKSRINHNYATNVNVYQSSIQQSATSTDYLTSKDLIKFIYHIAKGMEYVSSKCIVHRDLASRNILVNSQKICKIGDFGMARHMQSIGGVYERHSCNTKVPVRWMAPEVLLSNRFTTKSDVYSFGILIWEIVTLGSTPYNHLETKQVIEEVAMNGERPERPKYCHSQLYEIMSKCWSNNPDDRPTFTWLVKELDDLLLSANNYIELDQYPDHNYYNMTFPVAPNELV